MNKVNKKTRPPVVVILGHVDHGKTSILDYIRESKIAETESGGITQHTGAYQVEQSGKKITFIDTPGHEAFSAMRSRGVKVADIAVLVVAADDGIMPQTKEAIKIIKKSNLPLIVAINKIDKPEANVGSVKNQLVKAEILLEGLGGDVPNVEVSAKTGQGIDDLLDIINLVADLEEFSAEENKPLKLVVIEAALNAKSGPTATLLVKSGIIKQGIMIAGSSTWARVRQVQDFTGEPINEAGPSTPVIILGFNAVPQVGEKFVEVEDQKVAEERIAKKQKKERDSAFLDVQEGQKVVNLILKSDVEGTLEAVQSVLRSIENENIKLRILEKGVGGITDSDVRLAKSGNALVVGFRVKPNSVAAILAQQQRVNIVTFDTIYDLVSGVRHSVLSYVAPEVKEETTGQFKVLKIFRTESNKMIIGGRVIDGELRPGSTLTVFRGEEKLGKGKLKQIRSIDKIIDRAKKGDEVGISFDGGTKIEEGDILEAIEKKIVKFSL